MRAVWYSDFGPAAEVLKCGECDDPAPREGEVRVRVAFSAVNPVDVKRRAGGRGSMSAPRVIPHFDGAGVVDAVGAGVPATRAGERVWLFEAQWQRNEGTAAELAVVPAERAVPLPDGTSFAEGACLGIPALTAHRCVYADGPVRGRTVLVTGGAGAVGSYAVQLARLGGARVIATASTDEKADWARECGAGDVIDYRSGDTARHILDVTGGEGVDRVVDVAFGANLDMTVQILKPNAVVATYASDARTEPQIPFYQLLYKNAVLRFELVFLMPEPAKQQALADIQRHLSAGELRHRVAAEFPLEQAAAAHEAVEAGSFGKILLRAGDTQD